MGDPRRFAVFADYVARQWPNRSIAVADVAAGKGGLRAELYRRGYRNVTCFDRRRSYHRGRPGYVFDHFRADHPEHFDLVLGMHPDGASEAIVEYGSEQRVPFALVPCCAVSERVPKLDYPDWIEHLCNLGETVVDGLPMKGRNLVVRSSPVLPREPK